MNTNEKMNDNAESLIDGMGALAEVSASLFNECIKRGFTRGEALALTQTYLGATATIVGRLLKL